MCQHQATASDLRSYDTFAPTKNSSFEVSDDVIARDLWFAPPPPIKNPMAGDAKNLQAQWVVVFLHAKNFVDMTNLAREFWKSFGVTPFIA